ncbi:DUF4124 domain-containing protein [Undibacterium arcticum]
MVRRLTAPTRLAIAGWSLALLALVPVAARAEIYICKDGGGHTITSDRPVAECADRVMRVMSGGLVRREIAAPLTPEQRRQKQVEQDKLRADAVAAEEQRQLDRILLARYQSDLDIEAARKRALQPVQDLIAGSNQAIANAEKAAQQRQGRERVLPEQTLAIHPAPQAGRGDTHDPERAEQHPGSERDDRRHQRHVRCGDEALSRTAWQRCLEAGNRQRRQSG